MYVFWICLFLLVYTYFIFPFSTIFLARRRSLNNKSYNQKDEMPSVSILIAAYNEQDVIKEKVMSIINSNLPSSKIEIIIGSDCSTDNTNEIISKLANNHSFINVKIFTVDVALKNAVNSLNYLGLNNKNYLKQEKFLLTLKKQVP